LDWERLQGDGSERHWHRLKSAGRSLVMADHHLRASAGPAEADSFIQIGRHLARRGLAVPKIYLGDAFSGLVFRRSATAAWAAVAANRIVPGVKCSARSSHS
jgi:aminoglycoside/choline kinase family phosphotransferase